jgi:hypothetical protein
LIDHGDLASPPPFKFKILASFQDPLTRQIAESVRIEGAGEDILNSRSEYSRCRVPRLRLDMEGWKRLQKEQVPGKECMTTINEVEEGLGSIEDDIRRQASKRGAEEKVEKRTKKRKFPRLEGWGEGGMEPGDVSVPLGGSRQDTAPIGIVYRIEPCKIEKTAKQDMQASTNLTNIDKETEIILKKSKKLKDKKEAISKDVKKKKFKFNTRGKLRKDEIEELRRTHSHNIFSWVGAEQQKVAEMDRFEERASRIDKEVLMEVVETDLDRENRLERVKTRQQEFWTRKMVKKVLEEVMDRARQYRATEMSKLIVGDMIVDVWEHAMVNKMFKDVLDSGSGAVNKLETKLQRRWTVQQVLREVLEGVVDIVERKARLEMKEKKKLEWELRLEELEL